MAKSSAPLLALAGGVALLAMSGKKKKKKTTTDDTYVPPEDVYVPPSSPEPAPGGGGGRPAGNPPGGDSYDPNYWGDTTEERLEGIRRHFKELGYPVEVGPWPMNKLGPKGEFELTNQDGTAGKLGGEDDEPSAVVRQFQHDYNVISRFSRAEKIYPSNMGGLDEDGLVGYKTLNGLRYAVTNLPGGKTWNDLLKSAKNKGIS